MSDTLDTLVQDADDEQPGDLGCSYYLVRRLRLIVYVDIGLGQPVQVRRYHNDDDLATAWAAIEAGDLWEQEECDPFD